MSEIEEKKPILIVAAAIVDGMCKYTYKVNTGTGAGDKHNVDGSNYVHDDMKTAFAALNVHMALIDEMFKTAGIEVKSLSEITNHEFVFQFSVSGFVIKGDGDNESVVLKGSKYVSIAGGRQEITQPKIALDSLSSYQWHAELSEAIEKVRTEVELYVEGKFDPSISEEESEKRSKKNKKQLKLIMLPPGGDEDTGDGGESGVELSGDELQDFEKAEM